MWTEDDPLGLYVDEPPAASPPASTKPARTAGQGHARREVDHRRADRCRDRDRGWRPARATSTMLIIGLATLGPGMLLGGFVGRTLALLPLGILLAAGAVASTVFPDVPRNFTDVNYVAPAGETITPR